MQQSAAQFGYTATSWDLSPKQVLDEFYKQDPKGNLDNNATLRLIDPSSPKPPDTAACKNGEKALDWNQTGPQGQQGPQGATGATGPTGPSDVYSVDGYDQGVKSIAPFNTWVDMATTPTLPAGSYAVQSQITAENALSVLTDYACELVDSSTNVYQQVNVTGPNTLTDWVTIPVQAVITLPSADTITLRCFASTAGVEAFNWQLAAIKVGTVHS